MFVSNMIAWNHAFQPVYRHCMAGHISWSQGLSEAMKNLYSESRNFLPSNPHNYQCHQNPCYCSLMVKWLTKLQSEMPLSPDVREILGMGGGGGSGCPLTCPYPMVLYVLLFCKTTYHDGFTPISLCSYGHPTCYIEHEIFFYKVVCPK